MADSKTAEELEFRPNFEIKIQESISHSGSLRCQQEYRTNVICGYAPTFDDAIKELKEYKTKNPKTQIQFIWNGE